MKPVLDEGNQTAIIEYVFVGHPLKFEQMQQAVQAEMARSPVRHWLEEAIPLATFTLQKLSTFGDEVTKFGIIVIIGDYSDFILFKMRVS